ncbi:MAG: hypothetical protein WKF58_11835 [Ilumatobacteraceae bacterium]
MNAVGANVTRVDAVGKVTGEAAFPAERLPPDTLWATVVFTGQPHARLVDLDVSVAAAMPGVRIDRDRRRRPGQRVWPDDVRPAGAHRAG